MATKTQISPISVMGYIGAFLLILGCFSPIFSVSLLGSLTFISADIVSDGIAVLAIAIISILFILFRKYLWLYLTGVIALGVISYDIFQLIKKIADLNSKSSSSLSGAVQFEWGVGLLIIGGLLLLLTAYYGEHAEETSDNEDSDEPLAP
ncbi:MAG: hypothetical protein LUQ71_10270 [Methanoregula sp.]|nr:hypothetical protein [Methanoregula sp.]